MKYDYLLVLPQPERWYLTYPGKSRKFEFSWCMTSYCWTPSRTIPVLVLQFMSHQMATILCNVSLNIWHTAKCVTRVSLRLRNMTSYISRRLLFTIFLSINNRDMIYCLPYGSLSLSLYIYIFTANNKTYPTRGNRCVLILSCPRVLRLVFHVHNTGNQPNRNTSDRHARHYNRRWVQILTVWDKNGQGRL